MRAEDQNLDELLAGGYLAGAEYDHILFQVLEATRAPAPSWAHRLLASGLALAAVTAACALVLLRPMAMSRPPGPSEGAGEFRAKGQRGVAGAIDIRCASRIPHALPAPSPHLCHSGDTLMFQVNTAAVSGYLGAYAEPVDGSPRDRIWYFPTRSGGSPKILPGDRSIVLPDGITLGPEHPPGRYRLTIWISSQPLARSQIQHAERSLILSRATFDVEVVD